MKRFDVFFKSKSILFCFILICVNALPGFGQWLQTKGPAGGISNVILADNSGKFISGTIGGGIFVSSDNGQSWTQSISGISQKTLSVDYLDTIGQSIFMLGTSSFMKHLYQSTDHAQTWTENPISFTNATGLKHIGNRIFLGTNSEGLLYSDNMGVSWDTLPTYTFLHSVYPALYSIHVVGTDLFASVQDSGLYKSSNNGLTWVHAASGLSLTDPIDKMVSTGSALWLTHPYSNDLYKSTDGGLHWTVVPFFGNNNALNDLLVVNGNLYVVTDPHIFLTIDNGLNFTNFSGSVSTEYRRLAYNGVAFISITSFFGISVQRSIDNGLTWNESNYGYANTRTLSLYADGNNLFASTYDRDTYITSDFGLNYSRIPSPLAFDLFTANDIIKVGSDIVEGGYSKMYRSNNNGTTWVNCSPGIPIGCDLRQYLVDGSEIYAATSMGVYKSTSSFTTWLPANTGIPIGVELNSIVKNGSRIFVCGKTVSYDARLYYSDNAGSNWTDISSALNLGPFNTADKLIVSGSTILLSAGYHMYASTDNGQTWNLFGSGMPIGMVNKFFQYGTDLYAGMGQGEDPYGDILLSRDNGANWYSIRDDLFNSNVTSMAVLNGDLYVGTVWGGVWKRSLSTITVNVPKLNASESLFAVYPNPANDKLMIKVAVANKSTDIRILNASGAIVYTNNFTSLSLEVDSKQIANGVYSVQCFDGINFQTQKLVICH